MKTKFRHSFCAGFSLLELQIVIAMLVILAAVLLPLLESFKRAAQQAGCLNNLKQLGVTDLVYAADHGAFIEPSQSQYLGGNSEWMGVMLDNTSRNTNVLLCPTASQPAPASVLLKYPGLQINTGTGNVVGTADYYSICGDLIQGTSDLGKISISYMANGWLYSKNGAGQGDASDVESYNDVSDPTWVYTNEACMSFPATTPMFFDGTWVDCWPAEEDAPAQSLYTGVLGENGSPGSEGHAGYEMGRMTITRHGINPEEALSSIRSWKTFPPKTGFTDMVFGDGHAAPVKVNLGLWNLTWHRNWGVNVPVDPNAIPQ